MQFGAQETYLMIINVENTFAAIYFCGNYDSFFSGSIDEYKVLKNSVYLK